VKRKSVGPQRKSTSEIPILQPQSSPRGLEIGPPATLPVLQPQSSLKGLEIGPPATLPVLQPQSSPRGLEIGPSTTLPILLPQSSPRGLEIGPSATHPVFELEAPLFPAPSISSPATISREWTSNRGRHAPIPFGSPADLPASPSYMQLAQSQGPRPQSSLRQFLVVQNLVPAESAELAAHAPLERSMTVGSLGVSPGVGQRGTLSRQISAPAGSGTYVVAAPGRGVSRAISAPVVASMSSAGYGQAPIGIAELPSSPKQKKAKAAQVQMPGIPESSRGIESFAAAPAGPPKSKKASTKAATKEDVGSGGGAGSSKLTKSIPKVKTERSPALDAMLRSREVQDTATGPAKASKATKVKDDKPTVAKTQDLSRGLGGAATAKPPKPAPSSTKPQLKGQAPTPAPQAHDRGLQSPARTPAAKAAKHTVAPTHTQAKGPTAPPKAAKAPKTPVPSAPKAAKESTREIGGAAAPSAVPKAPKATKVSRTKSYTLTLQ
jgi:hypothetical protein